MEKKINIRNNEIKSPWLKLVIGMFVFLVLAAVSASAIFFLLPLIGIVIGVSVAIPIIALLSVLFSLPFLILGSSALGFFYLPFFL